MTETNMELGQEMTAGQMMKEARTAGRRKRELPTLSRVLCIKQEFLEALEEDDFTRIPELVYLLGFARNYAMELELDPDVVIEKIKRQIGLIKEEDAIEIEGEEPTVGKAPAKSGGVLHKRKGIIIIGAAALCCLCALGAFLALQYGGALSTMAPEDGNLAAEPVEGVVGIKYNLPIKREYGLRNRDYANIVLQATGTTWVQVKNAAGTIIFEHSMTAGDVYYALSGSIATIGNAGALDVWVDGREIPKMGADRQRLLDVVLTPENLEKH